MSPLLGFPPAFLQAKGAGAMSHTWAMCARMNENRSFMCCTGCFVMIVPLVECLLYFVGDDQT
jgi:hypothetical protein